MLTSLVTDERTDEWRGIKHASDQSWTGGGSKKYFDIHNLILIAVVKRYITSVSETIRKPLLVKA